jgi:Flp pilus assembly protein CpaB
MEQRTKADVPETAVYDLNQVRNLVAAARIDDGQIITASQFVQKSQLAGGLSNQITPKKGLQAISVSVDLQHGVAGLVAPGDKINLVITGTAKDLNNANEEAKSAKITAYLLSGLKVLAVDRTTAAPVATSSGSDNAPDAPTTAAPQQQVNLGLITLEVNSRQAEQIAHTYGFGFPIYITLNPSGFDPKDLKPEDEIVELYNYWDQEMNVLKEWQALVPKTKV